MIAVEKSHFEVDKEGSWPLSLSVGSELTVIHWALEKGNRKAFFKVWLQSLSLNYCYVRPETTFVPRIKLYTPFVAKLKYALWKFNVSAVKKAINHLFF